LAIALLAALWTLTLFITGGIDAQLFGLKISSHDPMKLVLVAALALAIYMLTGGDDTAVRWALAPEAQLARMTAAERLRLCRVLVGALTIVVTIGTGLYGKRIAGGSDSYGYLSQAELWLSGRLVTPQPWAREVPWPNGQFTFAPLGYVPARPDSLAFFGHAPSRDPWSIVPTYPPGLPMLMAGAKLIGGNAALFWVVPISAGLLVLATYGIGRRLGSPEAGTVGAFLVATSWPILEHALAPMSDVPTAALWACALWAVLGRTMRSAWAGGLALATVILVRPDRVPLGAAIVLWLAICVWRDPASRRRHIARAAVILSGLAAGMLAVAFLFWQLYGSPLESGYGAGSAYFATTYFWINLGNCARLFGEAQTPVAFLGVAALVIPTRRLWLNAPDRAVVPVLALFAALVWAEFCFINSDNAWLRFLFPSYPPIMIGLAAVLLALSRSTWPGSRSVLVLSVLIVGLAGVTETSRRGFLQPEALEAEFLAVGAQVRQETPENSVVLTMYQSGSIRYYAGRMTLRYDQMDPAWLDRSLVWLADRGVHAYAVLADWELPAFNSQFAGTQTLMKLGKPVFKIDNTGFYDLGLPAGMPTTTRYIPWPPRHQLSIAPAPPPTVIFRR